MTDRAVLFDLDGTLLDTAADFHTALNKLLVDEGKPTLDMDQVRLMVSNGSANLVANAFNMTSDHPQFEPLRQRLLHYYGGCMLEHTRPFSGLTECIALLQDRAIPWGIVTNKPATFSHALIEAMQLYPNILVCPEDTGKPKPHPDGILLACTRLNRKPANCLYIGDHLRDIDAGRAAGCQTMAAAYGYLDQGDEPESWGADLIAYQPEDLPGLLETYLL